MSIIWNFLDSLNWFAGSSKTWRRSNSLTVRLRSPSMGGRSRVFLGTSLSRHVLYGTNREIRFTHPSLPDFLPAIQLKNLRIGNVSPDLEYTRTESDVMINVTRKDDQLSIVAINDTFSV